MVAQNSIMSDNQFVESVGRSYSKLYATPPLRLTNRRSVYTVHKENGPQIAITPMQFLRQTPIADENTNLLPVTNPMTSASPVWTSQRKYGHKKLTRFQKWWRYGYVLDSTVASVPSILIAIILNLMICVPFGLSFFPSEWSDMPVSRALGIQMFLLTTAISQFVYVAKSSFHGAIGLMMLENVPFMHTISLSIIRTLGPTNPAVLPTILTCYAFTSVIVGVFFFLLGYFRLGNIVYFFPKHIIFGAIGGIGAFIVQNGLENATGKTFEWTISNIRDLFAADILPLWLVAVCLAIALSVLTRYYPSPAFPPFYFVSIVPIFYLVAWGVLRYPLDTIRACGWFFPHSHALEFYSLWEQYGNLGLIEWSLIPTQLPTIAGLSLFSLMHVPINIPSLSLTTGTEVDINTELIAHGISNTLSGLAGSVQNYLCYSTSALYYKCGGGGTNQGIAIGFAMLVFLIIGPDALAYVPRCLAGCLMFHIGVDLMREALIDTFAELDMFELITVWIMTGVMTFSGMNEGLLIGIVLASLTFVMQTLRMPTRAPVRASMSAVTLRSNAWRTSEEMQILDQECRKIHVVQLKGHLFFGNANTMRDHVMNLFSPQWNNNSLQVRKDTNILSRTIIPVKIRWLIMDFTLVVGLDSSAAYQLSRLKQLCEQYHCRIAFASMPPEFCWLTDHLTMHYQDGAPPEVQWFHSAADLNEALAWCEQDILQKYRHSIERKMENFHLNNELSSSLDNNNEKLVFSLINEKNANNAIYEEEGRKHLKLMLPTQPEEIVNNLMQYFSWQVVEAGKVIWRQGDASILTFILLQGELESILEETNKTEVIVVGAVVGELCFLTQEKRKTTLIAKKISLLYVLTLENFNQMIEEDCYLAFLWQSIALQYTSHRLQYVGNRIWETKCIPV